MVMPRQHVVAKKGTQKCLGFFLQCCPESYSDSWSCQAAAELRLVSQKPCVSNFVRKTSHVYTAKENDWGYSCFMTWMDILDENQGYMKDESVILEVYVKADAPKGILTHEAFCKKLQDYMKLADLQCSRSLIDKALEVNQSAMKFCKDKDEKMKAELNAQKSRLIEKKVKQSIERIEREDKNHENNESSNIYLKQAISGCANAKNGVIKSPKEKNGNKSIASNENQENDTPVIDDDSSPEKPIVNSIVKELVSNVSRKEFHEIVELEEAEASCSDESEDSDYEDIDEVCDSCLFERLENMSHDTPLEVIETQEISCQTDASSNPPPPPNSILPATKQSGLIPPVGAGDAHVQRLTSPIVPVAKSVASCCKESRLQFNAEIRRHHCQQMQQGGKATPTLNIDSKCKRFQYIAEENKTHLSSIKDTLERLVSLAQGGSEMSNSIQLELNMLKSKSPIKTDVVEIPASLPTSPVEEQAVPGVDKNSEATELPVVPALPVAGVQALLPPSIKNCKQTSDEERVACDLNWQKQQQFVQTDLSYTPRTPSPVNEDDCSILKHAKELVENKTEELVSKYSQLIEQSEANRLAETVKKVEKRMKVRSVHIQLNQNIRFG
ncbi:unnamed protein product [Soboliphyme baturini]|uniref:MATH domain-containing protein n=1 Tax=Soboliphyme baturini TaxID=241478 RepID=A0A183IGY6_9BILA|nr:unnamed protein product [Soboliphyme baturini]